MAKKKHMAEQTGNDGRCVLTLPLLTELWQEHIIETRFHIIESLKNRLIDKELRKLRNLERTRRYRELIKKIGEASTEARGALYRERNELLRQAGLTQFDFILDMASKRSDMQKHFAEHIASKVANAAAVDVWKAFETYLYGNGKAVHFLRKGELESVASESNTTGMIYRNGVLVWNGGRCQNCIKLSIRVQEPRNEYEREMLKLPICFPRIVRRWVKDRYKYYLQLILRGNPVKKPRPHSSGRIGIDIGTQTIAYCAESKTELLVLADRVEANHKKKLLLQQKLDQSRRITNPNNFNPDGTVCRGGGRRLHWIRSKRYEKIAGKVRELERKNAAIRKYQHTCLANYLLSLGDDVYVETMRFNALQRRAKETKKNGKGQFQKKKRFGKSLSNRAPATFLTILEKKMCQYGGQFHKVDTATYRASQLDHTTGAYEKAELGRRRKVLSNGDAVQRDLYSAFLLMNSADTLTECDLSRCEVTYPIFKKNHDAYIETLLAQEHDDRYPSSFGLQQFRHEV